MPVPSNMRSGFLAAASLAALLLAGCSTTDTFEQPAALPDVDSRVDLDRVWTMYVGKGHDGEFLHMAPLYAGDSIFAASADGMVTAVESSNGRVLWENKLRERLFAGPGADGRHLYLASRSAELIALSIEDGSEQWRASLPTEVVAAPQSNGTLVVAQTTDGRVIGFNASTGEQIWQYDAQIPVLTMRTGSAPLVGGDVVIASFANGRMLALTAAGGQPIWQYEVGQPQGRTELERLVDIGGQPLVLESAVMVAGYQGKLALVDIRSGQEIWSRPASSFYSPAIGNGNIYLASANGDVVALRGSDRREAWVQDKLSWRQVTRPAVSGDHLVVGDFEGYLHVLSAKDGSLQGQLKFDSEGIRVPVQIMRDGNLLVFFNGGKLSVLRLEQDD